MKKVFLIAFAFTAMLYGQTIIYYSATFDSGTTTGSTITFQKGIFLGGVILPDSLSDSCYFQTYDSGSWTNITSETGAVLYYKASTTEDRALAVDPKYFYPWKIIRPRVTDKPVVDRTVKVIGKEY